MFLKVKGKTKHVSNFKIVDLRDFSFNLTCHLE